jgi:hypothetical protein
MTTHLLFLSLLLSLAPLAIAFALDSLRPSPSQIPLAVRPSPRGAIARDNGRE